MKNEKLHSTVVGMTVKKLQTVTRNDPILGNHVRWKWPHHTSKCLQPYKKISEELTTEADCLLRGTGVVAPLKLRRKVYLNYIKVIVELWEWKLSQGVLYGGQG